eukprot:TRINITY_DN6358_c0_g1_i2.p1 TRINITY_DN6358_c0_g1~~TRINITY_DN6358_c0_g1_i2.p1  ORF type:complete len:818 (-),score=193.84 TRINITY_DN6358_c0_g1_i2:139-2592(-)
MKLDSFLNQVKRPDFDNTKYCSVHLCAPARFFKLPLVISSFNSELAASNDRDIEGVFLKRGILTNGNVNRDEIGDGGVVWMPLFKKTPSISLSFDAANSELKDEITRGNLKKRAGAHKWTEQYFVLSKSGLLTWFKNESSFIKGKNASFSSKSKEMKPNKKQIGSFQIVGGSNWNLKSRDEVDDQCMDAPDPKSCIQILDGESVVHLSFCAPDEEELKKWVYGFETVILNKDVTSGGSLLPSTSSVSRLAASEGANPYKKSPSSNSPPISPKGNSGSQSRASHSSRTSLGGKEEEGASPQSIEMDRNELEITGKRFGDRMKGEWSKRGLKVTVWEVEGTERWTKENWNSFHSKAIEYSKLEHENVEKLLAYSKSFGHQLNLVGERFEGDSLHKILNQSFTNDKMDFSLQNRIATEVCKALVYLQENGMNYDALSSHRIILEELNVANSQNRRIKLDPVGQFQTPSRYLAPEYSKTGSSPQATVFSFGLLLWEIATQNILWEEEDDGKVEKKLANKERPNVSTSPWKALIDNCWNDNPESRFTLNQVLSELKRVRDMLDQQQIRHKEREATLYSKDKIGEMISAIFVKTNVGWSEFRAKFAEHMGVSGNDMDTLDQLKFLFCSDGMVHKQVWEAFLLWFSPLSATSHYVESSYENGTREEIYENGVAAKKEDLYENGSSAPTAQLAPVNVVKMKEVQGNEGGKWELEFIRIICCRPWFHGFLESTAAQKELKDKPVGTFLIRFSLTTPGMYALSVVRKSGIYHGRIECSKQPGKAPEFRLDGKEYSSIDEMVEKHKVVPLISKTGEPYLLLIACEKRT